MYFELLLKICPLAVLLSAVASYLLGSVNFAIIISAVAKKGDVRKYGSGNAGATNMLRTYGAKLGAVTFILDILKGVAASALAYLLGVWTCGLSLWGLAYIGALFAIIGHMFPLYFSFKGGKGISTALGALFFIDWRLALLVLAAFIIGLLLTRMVSVGSILGAISAPIFVFVLGNCVWRGPQQDAALMGTVFITVMAVLIILKHWTNIKRIFNGTESRLFGKNKKDKTA